VIKKKDKGQPSNSGIKTLTNGLFGLLDLFSYRLRQ